MIERLIERIARRLPLRRIEADGGGYLLRHYVCGRLPVDHWPGVRLRLGGLARSVYLHCFVAPDQVRDLHSHPWDWSVSIILTGGYDEERWVGGRVVRRSLRAPAINVVRHEDYHRIDRLHTPKVWTLFVTGRKVGTWDYRDRITGVIKSRASSASASS